MKKMIFTAILLAVCISVCGCGGENNAVTTDGSTSMSKVILSLAEAYKNETGVSVSYNATGSGTGIQAVLDGRCDIGLSSRALNDEEKSKGLVQTTLAYDGIAVIVNPKNDLTDIDIPTLAKVFTGEIKNWNELGVGDGEIVLIGREAGSGTRDGFESVTQTANKCKYRQESVSTGDVISIVASNENAIGYASVASVKDNVKAIKINGVLPSEESIKSGEYALQRPFVLVTKKDGRLSEYADGFFKYITSSEAREIISKSGVVAAN